MKKYEMPVISITELKQEEIVMTSGLSLKDSKKTGSQKSFSAIEIKF